MRNAVRHTVQFLLFTNLWVALCLSTLVLGVARHYGITDCWLFAAFSFLGTFSVYTFHRLVRNRHFEGIRVVTDRSSWQGRRRMLLIVLTTLTSFLAAAIFFYLPVKPLSLVLLAASGIVVLFYALPFPGTTKSLRSVAFLKNYAITLVWIVLICVPPINREKHIDPIDIIAITLMIFAQIIPFDIRDLPYDAQSMKTLPQLIGKSTSQVLASAMFLSGCALLTFHYDFQPLLLLPLVLALAGYWIPQNAKNTAVLELIWDGALLAFGIFYYFL